MDWTYYSSLCKICQTGRDLSSEMYKEWGNHSVQSQATFGRLLPPRPVATRWQTVGRLEEFLLSAEPAGFAKVLGRCLFDKVQKQSDSVKTTEQAQFDELSAEELRAYSAKMGRWRRDTARTIEDPIFWEIVKVSWHARRVAEHLCNWLKGEAIDSERPWLCGLHHAQ